MLKKHYVVILHGIMRSSLSMLKISSALKKNGFCPININYYSTKYSIETHAQILNKKIDEKILDKSASISFVTHSMGGLVARQFVYNYKNLNFKRMVMLAPPNHGSEVADFFMNNLFYKIIFGKSGQQLGTGKDSFTSSIGEVDIETGIIAGNSPKNPLFQKILPVGNDGTVSVKSSKLKGMKDFIILPFDHSFIMNYQESITQTIYFLKNGFFKKN